MPQTGFLPINSKGFVGGSGDLALFDQGSFKLRTLAQIIAIDAFFLTRFLVRTVVNDPRTHVRIDLAQRVRTAHGNACEQDVLMGGNGSPEVTCRLIALRVSEHVADERRRRLKKEARKKGRSVSTHHLTMCDWTLLITNVPHHWLPLEMARALYTLRWQIKLLFKQLKSVLRVRQSNTGKEHRLRCELYGKLLGAVLIHRIHAAETNRIWQTRRREVSMDKFYKRFQERAFTLFRTLLRSALNAITYLRNLITRILPACLKDCQRSRLTTLQTLEAQWDPMLMLDSPAHVECAAYLNTYGRTGGRKRAIKEARTSLSRAPAPSRGVP